ncbi:MAG TPA: GTP cyclohydrolase II [Geminicoccaceae bacterium]|nr:GTP cyclohydrolase II [Geminicoccaceae bacterium]
MKPNPHDESDAVTAATQHAVDRAVADFRRGAFVVIEDGDAAAVAHAAEAATDRSLAALARLSRRSPTLTLTAQRAAALSLAGAADGVVGVPLVDGLDAAAVRQLADPTAGPRDAALPAGRVALLNGTRELAAAAVKLSKLARLLPAAVTAPLPPRARPARFAAEHDLLRVGAAAIDDYPRLAAATLRPVGEARVPLADAENSRIIAFRPADGGAEQYAIVIGEPDPRAPVLCRLHSACFTGDLLGSLRCDCGLQLRAAIRAMAAGGAGVVLYLAQEGRGIGLVNKLRAYQLQDRGLDTVEANEHLGFEPDERAYLGAATILRHLGIGRVRLMTNNPEKVGALARYGIEVAERVPIAVPSNAHNRGYLRTKAERGGHLLGA